MKKRLADYQGNEDALKTFDRLTAHLVDDGLTLQDIKLRFGPRLTFDPRSETFMDNQPAGAMLTREYRKPFVVPPAGRV